MSYNVKMSLRLAVYWMPLFKRFSDIDITKMCSGQFYEKWMSVRERNIKLLLEAVTYMATTKIATCIITIEIVICIMHCG